MKQNLMVPYESIDPAGAEALRPGVSFFVSNKTIAELIAEKGICPPPALIAAKANSANGRKISTAEAMQICALADSETSTADIELAIAALKTADGEEVWKVYHQIGEVLRSFATPEFSPDFAAAFAARLNKEKAPGQLPAATGEARPAAAAPPLLEPTSSVLPDSKQREA